MIVDIVIQRCEVIVLLPDDLDDLYTDGEDEDDQERDDGEIQHSAKFLSTGFIRGGGKLFLDEEREQDEDGDEYDGTCHGGGGNR